MSWNPDSLPTTLSPYSIPITRYPHPITIITRAIIIIRIWIKSWRIRIINWWRHCNCWGADNQWRQKEPEAEKDPMRWSYTSCQEKDQ